MTVRDSEFVNVVEISPHHNSHILLFQQKAVDLTQVNLRKKVCFRTQITNANASSFPSRTSSDVLELRNAVFSSCQYSKSWQLLLDFYKNLGETLTSSYTNPKPHMDIVMERLSEPMERVPCQDVTMTIDRLFNDATQRQIFYPKLVHE